MARLPDLFVYARKHQLKIISIADLISYRLKTDRFIIREAIADLPTEFGNFQIYGYRNLLDNSEATAIFKGNPERFTQEPILVRIHSECLTGDALGSLRCDCRQQLQTALRLIEAEGQGVVVYLKQEGRGIGLVNKLKAYSLQDKGLDTITANEQLLTNNPRKVVGLKGWDLNIVERVPLAIEENSYNSHYLATKAEKLGHFL